MRAMLLAGLVLFATNAFAAAYGDTAYALSAGLSCNGTTILSLPVNVSVPSRVYASAHGSYQSGGTDTGVYVSIFLRDSADATTVASSQLTSIVISSSSEEPYFATEGVLHDGSNVEDPAATIYVAAPGSYVLEMYVQPTPGSPCSGTPTIFNPTLTYILLSSAFDDIFADGFQAILDSSGSSVAVVA